MKKPKSSLPVLITETTFKTNKGQFNIYHLVDRKFINQIAGTLDVKSLVNKSTVTDTKHAFMKAINLAARSRVVFKSKESLLTDMDKRLHSRIQQNLPLRERILNKK